MENNKDQNEDLIENGQFGLKLSDVDDERLMQILRIYDQTVKGKAVTSTCGGKAMPTSGLRQSIKDQRLAEYRFGSRLTNNSKLWVKANGFDKGEIIVSFSFDDNIPYPKPEQETEAKKLTSEFRQATNRFIHSTGVGIPLSR